MKVKTPKNGNNLNLQRCNVMICYVVTSFRLTRGLMVTFYLVKPIMEPIPGQGHRYILRNYFVSSKYLKVESLSFLSDHLADVVCPRKKSLNVSK